MFTKLFWKDAVERAISTAAEAFVSVVGIEATAALVAGSFNVLTLDWSTALAVTAGAAVLSIAKALGAAKFVPNAVSPASLVAPPEV